MRLSFDDFLNRKEKIAVIGLGYVGLPLAVHLAKPFDVIGIDINKQRMAELEKGNDITGEVNRDDLVKAEIKFASDPGLIKEARVVIVTVPSPIDRNKNPDLKPIKNASRMIGENMSAGTVVVFESTVYPGVTEDICVPILEEHSGLTCGSDFTVGYSPERINPGDKERSLATIVKVVAGQDEKTANLLSQIYGKVITAGIHMAPDIRTAEAAKVIENIQRDLNIALMNELALIFNQLGIDTTEVLRAANTKWNFLKFEPGLVGGHCIGVDPYYLTYKAEEIGYYPTVILSGRRVNDYMGKHVAEQTVKRMIQAGKPVKGSKVLVLGFTFKENIKDIRNTKVIDIINELKEYGIDTYVHDPYTIASEVEAAYGIKTIDDPDKFKPYDAIIFAVKHEKLMKYDLTALTGMSAEKPVLIDVKSVFNKSDAENSGFIYWRL